MLKNFVSAHWRAHSMRYIFRKCRIKRRPSYENLRRLFSKKIFAGAIYVKWECDRHLAVFSLVILMQFHMLWHENSPIMPKKHALLSLTLLKTSSR